MYDKVCGIKDNVRKQGTGMGLMGVEVWQAQDIQEGCPDFTKTLYSKGSGRTYQKFSGCAVLQGVIPINPASEISAPKTKEDNVKEIAFMDLEQAKQFLC